MFDEHGGERGSDLGLVEQSHRLLAGHLAPQLVERRVFLGHKVSRCRQLSVHESQGELSQRVDHLQHHLSASGGTDQPGDGLGCVSVTGERVQRQQTALTPCNRTGRVSDYMVKAYRDSRRHWHPATGQDGCLITW